MTHWLEELKSQMPCADALAWMQDQTDEQSAWQNCQRGDWLLWRIGKYVGPSGDDSRKPLVWTACQCARLVLNKLSAGEMRPLQAIETAQAWARGEDVSLDDMRRVISAAYATSVASAAASAAAYAAASAASAAYATSVASAATSADAQQPFLKQYAAIVREVYPTFASAKQCQGVIPKIAEKA